MAALFLTNCTKETQNPSHSEGMDYMIFANSPDTKTVNDGVHTLWTEGDAINVFHAEAGASTFSNDGKFSLSNVESGSFTGTLSGTLAASNDWYLLYPYTETITTPKNSSAAIVVGSLTQTQTGSNSTAHIAGVNYPMWGIKSAASDQTFPNVRMTHLSSLVELVVENKTTDELAISSVALTAPEDIVGEYYVDFSSLSPVFVKSADDKVSSTASLTVSGATIAAGASAKFYFAIKPFVLASGKTVKLSVNGVAKEITASKDVKFTSGKIKTLTYAYEPQPSVEGLEFSTGSVTFEKEAKGQTKTVSYLVNPNLAGKVTFTLEYSGSRRFDIVDDSNPIEITAKRNNSSDNLYKATLKAYNGDTVLDSLVITQFRDFTVTNFPDGGTPDDGNDTDLFKPTALGLSGEDEEYIDLKQESPDSGAEYLLRCAGGLQTVTFKSDANSGLVVTRPAGYVKTVFLTWNDQFPAPGAVIDIYGSSEPYSSPADLYNENTQGELIGSMTYNENGMDSFEVNGNYSFFGLRPRTGKMAVYMMAVTWKN